MKPFLSPAGLLGVEVLPENRREEAVRALAEIFDVNPAVTRIRITEMYPAQTGPDAPLKFLLTLFALSAYTVQNVVLYVYGHKAAETSGQSHPQRRQRRSPVIRVSRGIRDLTRLLSGRPRRRALRIRRPQRIPFAASAHPDPGELRADGAYRGL